MSNLVLFTRISFSSNGILSLIVGCHLCFWEPWILNIMLLSVWRLFLALQSSGHQFIWCHWLKDTSLESECLFCAYDGWRAGSYLWIWSRFDDPKLCWNWKLFAASFLLLDYGMSNHRFKWRMLLYVLRSMFRYILIWLWSDIYILYTDTDVCHFLAEWGT